MDKFSSQFQQTSAETKTQQPKTNNTCKAFLVSMSSDEEEVDVASSRCCDLNTSFSTIDSDLEGDNDIQSSIQNNSLEKKSMGSNNQILPSSVLSLERSHLSDDANEFWK